MVRKPISFHAVIYTEKTNKLDVSISYDSSQQREPTKTDVVVYMFISSSFGQIEHYNESIDTTENGLLSLCICWNDSNDLISFNLHDE